MTTASFDAAVASAGVGAFQRRLFAVFGLVWAADAMQVLAIGCTLVFGGVGVPLGLAAALALAIDVGARRVPSG